MKCLVLLVLCYIGINLVNSYDNRPECEKRHFVNYDLTTLIELAYTVDSNFNQSCYWSLNEVYGDRYANMIVNFDDVHSTGETNGENLYVSTALAEKFGWSFFAENVKRVKVNYANIRTQGARQEITRVINHWGSNVLEELELNSFTRDAYVQEIKPFENVRKLVFRNGDARSPTFDANALFPVLERLDIDHFAQGGLFDRQFPRLTEFKTSKCEGGPGGCISFFQQNRQIRTQIVTAPERKPEFPPPQYLPPTTIRMQQPQYLPPLRRWTTPRPTPPQTLQTTIQPIRSVSQTWWY